jgi:multidrug transporter EmrE-like cation transporter
MGHPYDVIAIPANIFLTSMLYWHNPINTSWRYYVDVFTTHTMLLYAVYRAYNAEYMWLTYAIWTGVPVFNAASQHYYKNGFYTESVFFHALLHICGNAGCVMLFSGYVQPLLGDEKT